MVQDTMRILGRAINRRWSMLLIENGYMIDPRSGREGNYDILTDGMRIRKIGKALRRS